MNLSNTGSLDKAVLEAMNAGLIVLTSNEAYKETLPKNLMVERDQPEKLKEKISEMMNLDDIKRERIIQGRRKEVAENHSLNNLITKIVARFKK